MTAYEIIQKKKRGGRLSSAELEFFINRFISGEIPDYQAAALLMAVYFRGMDKDETCDLTTAMTRTGEPYDFGISGIVADKHSTGGVSDATTLIIAPLVALADIKFLKMSGRALGHTGGTIDKLESIPGFKAELSPEEVKKIINSTGAVIVGQSEKSAPADKKLYALRDVTATVDSIPLIAASIMSKKLLSPARVLVLDVKYGSGAFLKTKAEAEELADYMTYIGAKAGRKVSCFVSSMKEPLGRFIGNALELYGAVEVLEGAQNALATESRLLAAEILSASGQFEDKHAAQKFIDGQIKSGAAKQKLAEIIAAQGGDASFILEKTKLLGAKLSEDIVCARGGIIESIDCEGLGLAAVELGAGRTKKDDRIDHSAGIEVYKKIGDRVKTGDKLCKIIYNKINKDTAAKIADCFRIVEG